MPERWLGFMAAEALSEALAVHYKEKGLPPELQVKFEEALLGWFIAKHNGVAATYKNGVAGFAESFVKGLRRHYSRRSWPSAQHRMIEVLRHRTGRRVFGSGS